MSSPTQVEREHPVDVAVDPRLSRGVKAFLQRLNASGGPPLETLPPLEARAVLANAQASVPVNLSGIAESGGVPKVEICHSLKPTTSCFNGNKTSELSRHLPL